MQGRVKPYAQGCLHTQCVSLKLGKDHCSEQPISSLDLILAHPILNYFSQPLTSKNKTRKDDPYRLA